MKKYVLVLSSIIILLFSSYVSASESDYLIPEVDYHTHVIFDKDGKVIGKTKGGDVVIMSKDSLNIQEVKILNSYDKKFELSKDIIEWSKRCFKQPGMYYKEINGKKYILITAGEKPSSGYSLNVDKILFDRGTLHIIGNYIQPNSNSIVLTVITYPFKLIEIQFKGEVQNIVSDINFNEYNNEIEDTVELVVQSPTESTNLDIIDEEVVLLKGDLNIFQRLIRFFINLIKLT